MTRKIKDSWVAEYLKYAAGQESPELFHTFVAFSLISTALNRKVKMDKAYYELYPNLYTILVAGTSKCHKSAAIEIGVEIYDEAEEAIKNPPSRISQKITNEKLINVLGDNLGVEESEEEGERWGSKVEQKSSCFIAADELTSFLGKNALDTGIVATLTDLYSCKDKWEYSTKTAGKDTLRNVYINFLGASTARWLRAAIPQEAVGGGFASRCMFVYQGKPKRLIPFPEDEIPDDVETLKENLVHDLKEIAQLEGNFTLTPAAKQWYSDWYVQDAEELQETSAPDFFTRWPQFMHKLAMVVSVARGDSLKVTQADYKLAKKYLDAVKAEMSPVLESLTTTESELPTSKVLGIIRRRKKITHQALSKYTKHFVKSEGLKKILQTLEEAGEIERQLSRENRCKLYTYQGDGKHEEQE